MNKLFPISLCILFLSSCSVEKNTDTAQETLYFTEEKLPDTTATEEVELDLSGMLRVIQNKDFHIQELLLNDKKVYRFKAASDIGDSDRVELYYEEIGEMK